MRMHRLILFGCCLLAAVSADAERVRYDGHKVLRVYPKDWSGVEFLEDIRERDFLNLDFWEQPNQGGVDIHVKPEVEDAFLSLLRNRGIQYETIIPDLQELIDEETRSNEEARKSARGTIVGTFAKPDEISAWLKTVASSSPLATLVNIGKSYEGRDIDLIKISNGGDGKQAIFIDAGIHAREWISQATVVWIINKIVSEHDSDPRIKAMVDKFDWYLLPMVNPDGYLYSHDYERMWRKTRSNHGSFCMGTDANRNFDYPKFGGEGTSSNACSDIYKGPSAFSEVEALNLKNFILSKKGQIKMYLAVHSYSQMWLTPFGYTRNKRPDNSVELDRIAKVGADALYQVHKKRFSVGTAPQLMYSAAGGADDWAMGYGEVPYAYCLELRPGPYARNGFIVDASEIEASGEEVLAGIFAAAETAK